MRKNRFSHLLLSSIITPCIVTNEDNIEKKKEQKRLISNNEYKLEKPKSKYHK